MLPWALGCVYIFELAFCFFPDIYPTVELLDHMVALFLVFWRCAILFYSGCTNLHSHQLCTSVLFFSISSLIFVKAMAPHSSTLAWKIPWTEEPGRLQSMGSLRVGLDWATSLSLFTFLHWRRKWQPTPVYLPGESQGRGSLVGCRPWGHTELDMTEVT